MPDVDWDRLARRICGTLVVPSDPNFGNQVSGLVWNGLKPDRIPAAIAQCLNEGDVRECVLFARESGLKVIVHGGGCNWNGAQVRNQALVIDISQLTDVHIDPARSIAIVQPIVSNQQLITALDQYGLAYQAGTCPQVPMSGYLLCGGLGMNTQNWGAGCHGVEAVSVVTADGETIVCDETRHSDLFWAARGGSQAFPGVIVRYHIKVNPLPKVIHQVTCVYNLEDSKPFFDWLSKIVDNLPLPVFSNILITSMVGAMMAEDIEDLLPGVLRKAMQAVLPGDKRQGKRQALLTYIVAVFADTDDEARQLLAPFQTPPPGPTPVAWIPSMPTSFTKLNMVVGALFPYGRLYVADYHWVDLTVADVVDRLAAEFRTAPEADSFVLISPFQKPPDQFMPPGSTAFSISSQNLVGSYGICDDPADLPATRQWVTNLSSLLEPDSVGLYVGESDLEAAPNRAAQCYSPEAWAKLGEIKRKYDPGNLFFWFINSDVPS